MLSTFVFLMAAVPQADAAAVPPVKVPVEAPAEAPVAPPPAAPVAPLRSEELSKLIVKEAVAQQKVTEAQLKPDALQVFGAAPKADKYADFAVNFAAARVPLCVGPDGLKFNPPVIANIRGFGPIMLSGILALPWVVEAKLKGKCN
jgi:hypothetical protein